MTVWPEPFIKAILTPREDGSRVLTPPPPHSYRGSRPPRYVVPLLVVLILAGVAVWVTAGWAQTSQRQPVPIITGSSASSSSSSSVYTTCRMVGQTNVCTTQVDGHTVTTECRMVGKTQQCVTR